MMHLSKAHCVAALLVLFILQLGPSAMAADSPPSLDAFMAADTPVSVARLTIAASSLRDISNPPAVDQERWRMFSGTNSSMQLHTMDDIFQEYQFRVARDQQDALLYGVAGWTLKGAIIVGTAYTGGGTLPAIVKGLGAAGANAGIEAAVSALTSHGAAETSQWLKSSLADRIQAHELTSDLLTLKLMSPEDRKQWVKDDHLVSDLLSRMDGVRPEDEPIIQGMVLKALNDQLASNEIIQSDIDKRQDQEIERMAKQIGGVARTLNEFRSETANELSHIIAQQNDITNTLDTLAEDVSQTREGLEFVQQFMFEKMNPTEKLAALHSGFFSGMPDSERTRLTLSIEVIEKREELMKNVAEFSQGAAAVARIASRLGIDRNVVNAINTTSQVANVALTAATGFMNGGLGYLQAADAVSGLIFGSGPDAGAQRHAEIMAALGQIEQGISEIKQMVAEVSQQVEQVRQLQIATLKRLDQISDQIQANQVEVLEHFAQIRRDLVPISSIVTESLFSDVERCFTFRDRLRSNGFRRELPISTTLPYGILRSIDQTDRHGIVCREGLRERLSNPFGPQVTYALERFRRPSSDVEAFLDKVYDPTWQMIWSDQVLTPSRLPLFATSFTTPVSTLQAVNLKREILLGNAPPRTAAAFTGVDSAEMVRRLSTALSTQTIQRHACFLAYVHPFFELQEALQDPNPDKLATLDGPSIEGRELLRSTLVLVDTAIAQQVMIAGDAMLADLDAIWRDGIGPRQSGEADSAFDLRTAKWSKLQSVLKENGGLRYNLILQAVSRAIHENGNLLLYGLAFSLPNDATYLSNLLPKPQFVLSWKPPSQGAAPAPDFSNPGNSTGWQLAIGDFVAPLPRPSDVVSGKLSQSPALGPLLSLRNQLMTELEGYTIRSQISSSQRRVVRQAIWQVVSQQLTTGADVEAKQPCEQ